MRTALRIQARSEAIEARKAEGIPCSWEFVLRANSLANGTGNYFWVTGNLFPKLGNLQEGIREISNSPHTGCEEPQQGGLPRRFHVEQVD